MNIEQINNDFYNAPGNSFDKIPFETVLPNLLLKYEVGHDILEIGSAAGALAAWLAEQGHQVTCVEPADELAAKAAAKGLKVLSCSIQNFQGNYPYDSIIAISSLIHVPKAELPSQIEKIAKLLKSNGTFFVSFIEGEGEGLEDPTNLGKQRYFAKWRESELDDLLSPYFILLENHKIVQEQMNRTFLLRAYRLKKLIHNSLWRL